LRAELLSEQSGVRFFAGTFLIVRFLQKAKKGNLPAGHRAVKWPELEEEAGGPCNINQNLLLWQ
jgi:hypothetical protein